MPQVVQNRVPIGVPLTLNALTFKDYCRSTFLILSLMSFHFEQPLFNFIYLFIFGKRIIWYNVCLLSQHSLCIFNYNLISLEKRILDRWVVWAISKDSLPG